MSFYRKFPTKSFDRVKEILVNSGHDSVLNHIQEREGRFILREPIKSISLLPTYQFAVACALASLGNHESAECVYPNGEQVVVPGWGDNISRELAQEFMA